MRDYLAEKLLVKVMGWNTEDVVKERPILQALAAFKYDEYHQYSPGMRFIESLACWLEQFTPGQKRKLAYQFVRSRLIFFSDKEIEHLVSIAFRDIIRPFLIKEAANRAGIVETAVLKIGRSRDYKIVLRQSLFLGLSDGAHVDLYRRSEPLISQEQVWLTYDVSLTKSEELLSKLEDDLKEILGNETDVSGKKFRTVFLLDDFSGSGISYIRQDSKDFGGKLFKTLDSLQNGAMSKLVRMSDLRVYMILLIATNEAILHIRKLVDEWSEQTKTGCNFDFVPIQEIPDSIKIGFVDDENIIDILKEHFDDSIIDEHYRKGKYDRPHLGFNECSLPLVLSHNTPNNSIPLLWFEEDRKYKGLFPRVSRHRANREN